MKIKLPKVKSVQDQFKPDHIFDFTTQIFKFPDHNGEDDIFKNKHQRLYFDHQLKIKNLSIPKICEIANGNCKHEHFRGLSCKERYKDKIKEICPENCGCKYKCLCGWEPKRNLTEKEKTKQITKHFKLCIRLECLAKDKPRYSDRNVFF